MQIACILLAAGTGSRFGGDKLAYEYEGKSLIERAVSLHMSEDYSFRIIVARPDDQKVLSAVGKRFDSIVFNSTPDRGISSSIILGLQRLKKTELFQSNEIDGILFSVSDQPNLLKTTLDRMINAFEDNPTRIVAPVDEDGRRGNPVIFPVAFIDELLQVVGDKGGSSVIKKHEDRLLLIQCQSEEMEDIDYRQDVIIG